MINKHNKLSTDFLHIAQKVLTTEANALGNLLNYLDDNFNKAVHLLHQTKGKVIITGIGKSGHIGRKMAASFSSTGTPSFFLHPSEAIHGDLGMLSKADVVIAIANSGETTEIIRLLPFIKKEKIGLISISSRPDSTLAKKSDVHLYIGEFEEACPLNLAPTTSSMLTMALGDALMVALMNCNDINEANFAKYHPGGNIGKRLLEVVADVMLQKNLPYVSSDAKVEEVIYSINSGRCGLTIVGNKNKVEGIITDGDLRRAINTAKSDFFQLTASDIMTQSPKFVLPSTKLIEAKNRMNTNKITSLLVGNSQQLVGIIQLHDINL